MSDLEEQFSFAIHRGGKRRVLAETVLDHIVVDVVARQMAGGFDRGNARAVSVELGDVRPFMQQHADHHRL